MKENNITQAVAKGGERTRMRFLFSLKNRGRSYLKLFNNLRTYYFDHLLLRSHLIKGQRDYQKFIILGGARTGTTLLVRALFEHQNVMSFGEVLIPDGLPMDTPRFPYKKMMELRQNFPVRYLEEAIYKEYKKNIFAVGFKILYWQLTELGEPVSTKVLEYLEKNKNIKIIHIKRRNYLHSLVSQKKARISKSFVNYSGIEDHIQKFSIDYPACCKYFEYRKEAELKYDSFFERNPKIDVFYTDLSTGYEKELMRILPFLGVEYKYLAPSTHKQSNSSISDTLDNYIELKEKFAGSEWEHFFDE